MNVQSFIFCFFVLAAFGSALAILFSKNIFKAALWLLACLLSIAALFVMSFAEFVAVAQILIYAGGVLVVILFGIMFTSKLAEKPLVVENTNLFSGILAGALFFGLLAKLILHNLPQPRPRGSTLHHAIDTVGNYLVTDYSLAFEIVGILLLIALVGAAVITAFMKLNRS